KSAVTEYMDELSPAARIIGACNTIVNDNGKLVGHITDGVGYVRNLKENGVEVKGKKITIMGAGGAATAIQVQCALDGAREISIFNPKDDFYKRAEQTVENIKKDVPECVVNLYDLEDTNKLYEEI
ncbi:shikimate dehydrogenase, partial [Clostridioides difficile]